VVVVEAEAVEAAAVQAEAPRKEEARASRSCRCKVQSLSRTLLSPPAKQVVAARVRQGSLAKAEALEAQVMLLAAKEVLEATAATVARAPAVLVASQQACCGRAWRQRSMTRRSLTRIQGAQVRAELAATQAQTTARMAL